MKKLAKLTALLLTGVMLLLLASCGAAPNPGVPGGSSGLTAAEAKAKREIFKAIKEERQKVGKSSLQEVTALTQLEQEFIEHFREAGTNGIPLSEADKLEEELYNKQKEAGWQFTGGIAYSHSGGSAKLSNVYEGDTEAFRKMLKYFSSVEDASTALSIGVVTIEGKIYWTATTLKPIT